MKEIWKDIVVDKEELNIYNGVYLVSNYGRVKRIYKNGKFKILKPYKDNDGYLRVGLSKDCISKVYLVHRLVLLAFDYNSYFKGALVNHKDENPSNNYIDNLEWCTSIYNNNYGNRIGKCIKSRTGKYIGLEHHKSRKVICTTTNMVFNLIKDAASFYSMNKGNIIACCKGVSHYAGKLEDGTKLKWMYYEDYLS